MTAVPLNGNVRMCGALNRCKQKCMAENAFLIFHSLSPYYSIWILVYFLFVCVHIRAIYSFHIDLIPRMFCTIIFLILLYRITTLCERWNVLSKGNYLLLFTSHNTTNKQTYTHTRSDVFCETRLILSPASSFLSHSSWLWNSTLFPVSVG